MYKKIILNTFFVIGLFVLQFSFISVMPGYFRNLNLLLVIIIFILGLGNFRLALFWAVGLGFALDMFSFFSFNIFLISLAATVSAANFLFAKFFTDRSLYSFIAMTLFSTLFYEACLFILIFLDAFFGRQEFKIFWTEDFLKNELSKFILNALAIIILYYSFNLISKNFKPVFLVRNK